MAHEMLDALEDADERARRDARRQEREARGARAQGIS
jgi:hypothetical protein